MPENRDDTVKPETRTTPPAKNPLGKAMIPIGFAAIILVLLLIGWGVQENPEIAPEEEVTSE
ncbi:hypothetical protein SAMN05444417_2735 [Wenxinia saemankumensis]|uniref:Uncharacterized protein n=1 Tax=Wenxinia saemankumensis TaxID=1447782 RepID=A0A1M6G7Z1_9RHOB|nr:hypothetical protein SAMN05444417_2735 [Wenxinia saemankumensis]